MPTTEQESAPNEQMRALANRIRAHLARKGWTQTQLEDEAGFAQGALSRILAARQRKLWPRTLNRIARALGIRPEELAGGVALAQEGGPEAAEGVGPALADVPGYANAEIQVARRAPHVPIEVFEEARKTRLASPPSSVTVEFLHAHVSFLMQHVFHLGKTSERRTKPSAGRSQTASGKKRAE